MTSGTSPDPLAREAASLLEALDWSRQLAELEERHDAELRQLLVALLGVSDSFDRLLSGTAEASVGGSVGSIARQLEGVLEQAGVVGLACLHQRVDPKRHEIVETRHGSGAEEGQILEVLTRGYTWRGEILRRPRVAVASISQENETQEEKP